MIMNENEKLQVFVYEKLTKKRLEEVFKEMMEREIPQDKGRTYYWIPQDTPLKIEVLTLLDKYNNTSLIDSELDYTE